MLKVTIVDGVTPALTAIEKGAQPSLLKTMSKAGEVLAGEIRRQVMSKLAKDPTGNLARSFKPNLVKGSDGSVDVAVMSDVIYAETQDQGGIIKPKGKALAVPIRGAGVPRGKWPRDFAKGQLFRMPGTNVLAQVSKGKGKAKPMFTLQRSVTIRGVKYIDAALFSAKDDIEEITGQELGVRLDKAAK